MKNKHIIGKVLLGGLCLMMLSQSCDKRDVFSYEADRALFFERWEQVGTNKYVRLDTVQYFFSHYVGAEDLEHRFKVNLIGNLLEEDMEYRVIVVDSLTTATKDQYTIKDPVFRKGRSSDSLTVILHKTPALKDKQVHLTLRLVENENFGLGYIGYTDVRVRFNDMKMKPLWWTKEIELAFLGPYSYEKLEAIVAANEGFTTFEGLDITTRRKIALNTKEYIRKHGITEANGDAMVIPIY